MHPIYMDDPRPGEEPAFPCALGDQVQALGLTIRQWYAAHAPEVPPWFKAPASVPVVAPRDLRQALRERAADKALSPRVVELLRGPDACELLDGTEDTHPDVQRAATLAREVHDEVTKEIKAYEEATQINREVAYFAWRWHYADSMVRGVGRQ